MILVHSVLAVLSCPFAPLDVWFFVSQADLEGHRHQNNNGKVHFISFSSPLMENSLGLRDPRNGFMVLG